MNTQPQTVESKLDSQRTKSGQEAVAVSWVAPRTDVFESADEYLLVIDVPGVVQENATLEVHKGQLKIEATAEVGKNSRGYRRLFQLPDTVDAQSVKAELRNGVLHVHLNKAAESKPRRIQIGSTN